MQNDKRREIKSESKKISETLSFSLGIIFIGCLIQLFGKAKGDNLVFPSLTEILKAFFHLLCTPDTYKMILTSIIHLLAALAISSVIGITIGLLQALNHFCQNFFRPIIILLRSIPMLVLVVIIMVLAEYRVVPYIATSLALIPLFSEAVLEGCQSIDQDLIDVYKLNGGFSLRAIWSLYLPLIQAFLRQAFANAAGMGMKIVISAEYLVQSKNSLGKAIFSSSYFSEYAEIYAYALIMIFLILIIGGLPKIAKIIKNLKGN